MEYNDIFHEEQMSVAEYQFVQQKEHKDSKSFVRITSLVAVLFVVFPIIFGVVMEILKRKFYPEESLRDQPSGEPSFYVLYFWGFIFMALLLVFAAWLAYRKTIKPLKLDLIRGKKIIERSLVVRKQRVKTSGACYFYINSAYKLSIEVSADDYDLFDIGDEINIEYSTFAKIYFGYY